MTCFTFGFDTEDPVNEKAHLRQGLRLFENALRYELPRYPFCQQDNFGVKTQSINIFLTFSDFRVVPYACRKAQKTIFYINV